MRYLFRNPGRLWTLFLEHLELTGLTLLIALLIAVPLGLLLARRPRLQAPLLGLLSILYTIPSLAMFVLILPLLGLGTPTALTTLVVYAQVILVRNIVTGLEGVPRATVEAARGMGMSSLQIFWRVELPLALPVILAGLRVATLSTIAIGTLAALVGAGGLGKLLFEGIQTNRPDKIVAGAVTVSTLAILVNTLIRRAEQRATRALHLGP